MIVPNYVPDPVEIPGNVGQEAYQVRLGFLRRTWLQYAVSVATIWPIGYLLLPVPPRLSTSGWIVGVLASLLGLSVIRAAYRGTRKEMVLSVSLLFVALVFLAGLFEDLASHGLLLWPLAVGVAFVVLYAMVCGRDYSFIGQFLVSAGGSFIVIVGVGAVLQLPNAAIGQGLTLNILLVSFLVYDSASMLSRRRLGEEPGAVVDLYRDTLNFIGYIPRVVSHWRKHRIWEIR